MDEVSETQVELHKKTPNLVAIRTAKANFILAGFGVVTEKKYILFAFNQIAFISFVVVLFILMLKFSLFKGK